MGSLLWFRQDLRLTDNPALQAALKAGGQLTCLYILDDETPGRWQMGGASRWWLHHSLEALDATLRQRGNRLVLRRGKAEAVLPRMVAESAARQIFWNRCYEPFAISRDKALKQRLQDEGLRVESHNAALLLEPWQIKTGGGGPYKVFTPFWRALRSGLSLPSVTPAPESLPPAPVLASDGLEQWGLLPRRPDWSEGFNIWQPGEAGAQARAADFLEQGLARYATARELPAEAGSSRLSPHLHFGEIGPRQLWQAVPAGAGEKFLSELAWREFSYHLLYHWPALPERNWRSAYDAIAWNEDPQGLAAWQRGETGYPIVDAGLRELWTTGWMHNRVRMLVASFLIKDLLVDWRQGADWFWDTLLDADLANNSAAWQWVAGTGADAAPYFRIFNPVTQGQRFDPDGRYLRRWLPELAGLPDRYLHCPWEAPAGTAGVLLGRDYPQRLIAHDTARRRALAAYQAARDQDVS